MPRLLFITQEIVPFHYGGIGTLFKSVARQLKEEGHAVSFLSRKPPGFDEAVFNRHYGEIPIDFVPTGAQDDRPFADPFCYAMAVGAYWETVVRVRRPDVVVFADFCAEGLIPLLKNRGSSAGRPTRFIVTIQGSHGDLLPVYGGDPAGVHPIDGPHYRTIVAMEDLAVLMADEVLAPTAWVWGQVSRRLGLQRSAHIVPNTLDQALFIPPASAGKPAEGRAPLVFVGRLDRVKGADLLLEAYIEVAARRDLPDLVMIGRDCIWPQYGSTFLEHWRSRIPAALHGKISFPGQLPHERIGQWMRGAGVCIFPSRWESFGIVCLEAMALGCPVIVSRQTGLGEVLGAEFEALTFDAQRGTEGLIDVLEGLAAGDRSLDREALGEKLQYRARRIMAESAHGWRAGVTAKALPSEDAPVIGATSGRYAELLCALYANAGECRRGTSPSPAARAADSGHRLSGAVLRRLLRLIGR
jgi:glycosyltransferase involved in cell wall biosynthesis